jgi:multidrug resistance efflux pump
VDVGQRVRAGQALARIDAVDYELALAGRGRSSSALPR